MGKSKKEANKDYYCKKLGEFSVTGPQSRRAHGGDKSTRGTIKVTQERGQTDIPVSHQATRPSFDLTRKQWGETEVF